MCFSTLFIKAPADWGTVTAVVLAITGNSASDVRWIGSIEELTGDKTVVEIVVMQLYGEADYALEIYWKGMVNAADDAVAMYLASALNSAVLISDCDAIPEAWLRLDPTGTIQKVNLDIRQLDDSSIVAYKIA